MKNKICNLPLHQTLIAIIILSGSINISAQVQALTARQVIEKIKAKVGVPWQKETVDEFKAGNPDKPVTGIVCTMFATYEVLEKAVASGKNLIICHEPVFYSHLDHTAELEKSNDKVFADKKKYIEDHNLVVWRFHDHWHARKPDGIMRGMVHAIGWEKYENPKAEGNFVIPETSLEDLAKYLRDQLDAKTLRFIGKPDFKVSKICLLPGAPGSDYQIKALRRNDVDVVLMGESPEWETASWVRDAVAQGKPKAIIVLGHVPSEESGMIECADWLKTFITELPIEFIAAGETYSRLR